MATVLESGIYPIRITGSGEGSNERADWIRIDAVATAPNGEVAEVSEKFFTRFGDELRHRNMVLALSEYRMLDLLLAAGVSDVTDTEQLHGIELFAYVEKVEATEGRPRGTRDARGRFLEEVRPVTRTHNRIRRYMAAHELRDLPNPNQSI